MDRAVVARSVDDPDAIPTDRLPTDQAKAEVIERVPRPPPIQLPQEVKLLFDREMYWG